MTRLLRVVQFVDGSGLRVGVLDQSESVTTARLLDGREMGLAGLIRQARETSSALTDLIVTELESSVESVEVDLANSLVRTKESTTSLWLPVQAPEVWAAGVTYKVSREARLKEAETGSATFYSDVYTAERPELFLKDAGCRRTVPSGGTVGVRGDSVRSVPEPELALILNSDGHICGFTVGNDVTARDIEAVNPLYLTQAKIFSGSCSLGPVALITDGPAPDFEIYLRIMDREGKMSFEAATSVREMKRDYEELVAFLLRFNLIDDGTVLLTGTGIVPPDEFGLTAGDTIEIEISNIGVLRNSVMSL
jgi:2-dehydro-3-deoxy-D-arabinonate dehydratase